MGDFNSIINDTERKNCEYNRSDSKGFDNFIKNNNLLDITFDNTLYTWFGPKGKCSKLDRFLINDKWFGLGLWQARSSCRFLSDHKPILIQIKQDPWGPKPFKAFNWWLQEPEVSNILQQFWQNNSQGTEQKNIQTTLKGNQIFSKFLGKKCKIKVGTKN